MSANTGSYNLQYQIENLLASLRAGLDLDSFTEVGDDTNPLTGIFSTNAATFSNLASGGTSSFFDVFINTTGLAVGPYSATYLFNVSDQNLPGAINLPQLTLSVNATILSLVPEPSTYALGLIGLAGLGFVALRKKYRRV